MLSFGIDVLLRSSPTWRGGRIALVTNEAATTRTLQPSRQALLAEEYNLVRLFSPEHGLSARGADGALMRDGTDALTGLPVTSLYSSKLAPTEEDLADIDMVLFDVPDAGARFYTYLWTMTHLLEACAAYGKKLVILDRPNPVSGRMELAEGPMLAGEQASFIGRWPMPVRHSCTMGELAGYFNISRNIGCQLEVVRCDGWDRNSFQPDWGMPFVPTSPALQDFRAMLLYPGLCLLEATNVSEGRGTEHSFRCLGAPWIDGSLLANLLQPVLEEVRVEPFSFTPGEAKFKGERCHGVLLEAEEPTYFQPVFAGMLILKLLKDLYPSRFIWKGYPTLVNPEGTGHLDKLLGIADAEALFSLDLARFIAASQSLTRVTGWAKEMRNHLLY